MSELIHGAMRKPVVDGTEAFRKAPAPAGVETFREDVTDYYTAGEAACGNKDIDRNTAFAL